MLDVVKFQWQNRYGYWAGPDWLTVLTEDDDKQIRSRASLGRPGLQDIRILDRATMPESIRGTGRSLSLKAQVVLYDKEVKTLSAAEFIQRMEKLGIEQGHLQQTI